ncbi:tetratricopeptide repeat protein [Nitrospira sp. Nam74]
MKHFLGLAIIVLSLTFVSGLGWADMGKATAAPLKTASGSSAEMHNNEGIEHFRQGHWDVAKKHFMEAAKADPKSAEAHYNLALTLDKAGDHKGATEHFKTAYELGKDNHDIQESGILKAHLKMK